MAISAATQTFRFVPESNDEFLALFPHRYDFIYAEYPEPGEKPDWKTESRYPLPDRLVNQGTQLFGVRFGSQTSYCLLDIDSGSAYHPRRDRLAISRIQQALEPLGLVSSIVCASSDSNGIHLYFPFSGTYRSWKLAYAVSDLLEKAGFKLKPGQLEVFPNPKPYAAANRLSLFHAHRLPLQAGSYLLNADFQPIWGDRSTFVRYWQCAQDQNELDETVLQRALKRAKRQTYQVSGKAEKFLDDLNTEIEEGWTGYGQTNRLLGRIAMRAYIFHSVLTGGNPLTGAALVAEIVATARSLPGYQEWCRHQHEIEARAEEWARCIENSRYFPYGAAKPAEPSSEQELTASDSPESLTWNQQQSQAARERIRQAIANLLEINSLPAGATARFRVLTGSGIGGSSLYRHRDLWHPDHLVENPPDPPASLEQDRLDSAEGASNCLSSTSLFPAVGRNPLSVAPFSSARSPFSSASGSNEFNGHPASSLSFEGSDHEFTSGLSRDESDPFAFTPLMKGGRGDQTFDRGDLPPQLSHVPGTSQFAQSQWYQSSPTDRRQQFLASRDPILMAEAQRMVSIEETQVSVKVTHPMESRSPDRSSPLSPLSPPSHPEDFSELLTTIAIHLRRLGWTREDVRLQLQQQFGKSSQARLSDRELHQWGEYLAVQSSVSNSG